MEHLSGHVRTFGKISSIESGWEQYEITLYIDYDGNIISVMDPKSVIHLQIIIIVQDS